MIKLKEISKITTLTNRLNEDQNSTKFMKLFKKIDEAVDEMEYGIDDLNLNFESRDKPLAKELENDFKKFSEKELINFMMTWIEEKLKQRI